MPVSQTSKSLKILSVDVGGSHIKATMLDENGSLVHPYVKAPTPDPASPERVMDIIRQLVADFPVYDRISAGFPGYVKEGVVKTAPNLDTSLWADIDFQKMLEDTLGKPARVVNDADLQGLGVVSGKGLELVITLGTGFGSALLYNGTLLPHLEIAHHPITKRKDYDQYIGDVALEKIGVDRWNRRMQKILNILETVFNYDTLYIGGGNARLFEVPAGKSIRKVQNKDGIRGGARLWTEHTLIKPVANVTS